MAHRIRVLLAKVGLDGHDRGVKVVARTLRDAGMDVVYSGLHRTPEEVVNAAVQEDVDVLGVSLLSGVQMTVFPKIFSLLKEKGVDDMIVVAGGVMPDEDVAELKKIGVAEIMIGRSDWRAIANAHARIMWGMGMRPGDIVCVAAIFSLYVGSWGALAGAERLGAKAFPFGAGAAGMTARCAQWLDMLKPAAFYGTPTYALHLASTALDEGLDPRGFGFRAMFFSGEPGASIPAVRGKIEELYSAKVFDCGSMGEMTPWMNVAGSAETDGMLCWQDVVYTEVCDPVSFHRVPYGARGTPVYTHLERTSQPMIRLLSGDLTLWENGPNPCGRTYPRLPMGIIGRIDDMFTVRGENVYPSEIDAVLNQTVGYGGEHRIIITRESAMDELAVRVEAVPEIWQAGQARVSAFRADIAAALQKLLGLRAVIEILPQHSFERTDFKARRVLDDREVLRDMRLRQEKAASS